MKQAQLRDLGRRDYQEVWQLQRELVEERRAGRIPDTLLLCEHDEVLTVGRRSGARGNILSSGIPVVEVERGGDVTYHGPGQLVGYPILLLDEDERDLHAYLRHLEEAHLRLCADLGLAGRREPGWTGVWVGERKLVSLGVAVRRWVTYHGFALNVATDLSRFFAINPCGLDAAVMTSLSALLGRPVTLDEVKPRLVSHLGEVLGRTFAV